MGKTAPKVTFSPSRDIPLDKLELSPSNVRKIFSSSAIAELADDIARLGLLHGLGVRPVLDEAGAETGRFEIPFGSRRFRALHLLVKQKRLAKDAPIPCTVRATDSAILAEDESLAENARREALHPLDQFRAMQAMVEKGDDVETIAAHLRDSAPGQAIAERRESWRARMPRSDKEIWDWVLSLGADDQWSLFAHCVSVGVNAQREAVKYDNGRTSPHGVERRVAHSHIIARAVGLDVVAAGWKAKADNYLAAVPKPRILADVTEARGENFAQMIDHLKKADMAREAERLLDETDWLPEPLRTPQLDPVMPLVAANDDAAGDLPAGLANALDDRVDGDAAAGEDPDAVAAE